MITNRAYKENKDSWLEYEIEKTISVPKNLDNPDEWHLLAGK